MGSEMCIRDSANTAENACLSIERHAKTAENACLSIERHANTCKHSSRWHRSKANRASVNRIRRGLWPLGVSMPRAKQQTLQTFTTSKQAHRGSNHWVWPMPHSAPSRMASATAPLEKYSWPIGRVTAKGRIIDSFHPSLDYSDLL